MPLRRKTSLKFAPSHIKRMMQQDEDVGKVAQAVPSMIGKSLELFATNLLIESGEEAQERGAKTLTQEHVASVVRKNKKLDFLLDLVRDINVKEVQKKSRITTRTTKVSVKDVEDIGEKISISNKLSVNAPKEKTSKANSSQPSGTSQAGGLVEKFNKQVKHKSRETSSQPVLQFTFEVSPLPPHISGFTPPTASITNQCLKVDEDYDC